MNFCAEYLIYYSRQFHRRILRLFLSFNSERVLEFFQQNEQNTQEYVKKVGKQNVMSIFFLELRLSIYYKILLQNFTETNILLKLTHAYRGKYVV